jgi:ABC-2 type transport system ATP-binding protein
VAAPGRHRAAEPPEAAVRLNALGVRYRYGADAPALDGLDLSVRCGEVVALVGPNGAGKSTLLRILAEELTPGEGVLELFPPKRAGRSARGYAPEEAAHFEPLSGRSNALFFAQAAGLSRTEAEDAVEQHIRILGLTEDADRAVSTYSFGARRKLLLVEALAHRPSLALLDEPTTGLDAQSREAFAQLVRKRALEGTSVVLASHDLALVAELADRVVFLHAGRVVAGGRPEELVAAVAGVARFEVTLLAPFDPLPESFGEGIRLVSPGDPLVFESLRGQAGLPETLASLVGAGGRVRSLVVRDAGLAEAFRRLTGQALEP